MANEMLILPGFTFLLIISLLVVVWIVHKTKPQLGTSFWLKVAVASVVTGIGVTIILYWNGLAYGFAFAVLAAGVRTASEFMFETKYGGLLLGGYFGFWLSLPFVVNLAI